MSSYPIAGNESFTNVNTLAEQIHTVNAANLVASNIRASVDVQTLAASIASGSSQNFSVTYPVAFNSASVPAVFLTTNRAGVVANISSSSYTGFTYTLFNATTVAIPAATVLTTEYLVLSPASLV